MPRYDFRCHECENVQEESMRIAELGVKEVVCSECGSTNTSQTFTTISHAFMAPEALGRKKAPGDFRNFLSAIKKAHPDGHIRDR